MIPECLLLHSHYQVGVVLLPEGASVQNLQHPDDLFPNVNGTAYDPSACDRASPTVASAYVTAEFASGLFPSGGVFLVGSPNSPNDRPSVYTNGELCYSKSYAFFLRAYPVANPTVSQHFILYLPPPHIYPSPMNFVSFIL